MKALRWLAGPGAREHIAREGLRAQDIAGVAAAAGGPKGLAFLPFDAFLFGEWLSASPRPRVLAGASIGAWRMAAALHPDGTAATRRLGEAYLELQRYPMKPAARLVSQVCGEVVAAMLGDVRAFSDAVHAPGAPTLALITARARGALAERSGRRNFARPALANLLSRERLGRHLQRVVFSSTPCPALWPEDRFDTLDVRLSTANAQAALLASGTIPLVAEPVIDPPDAPSGQYWDGGLIDYHLLLRWDRLDGLVLHPHFTPWLTPGWLDKALTWRRVGAGRSHPWLDRVLMVVPSDELLARLPGGRLPERQDFHRHGTDHATRIAAWRRAMAECQAMVDDFDDFTRHPDPGRLEPI